MDLERLEQDLERGFGVGGGAGRGTDDECEIAAVSTGWGDARPITVSPSHDKHAWSVLGHALAAEHHLKAVRNLHRTAAFIAQTHSHAHKHTSNSVLSHISAQHCKKLIELAHT